ncbi:unnamed protein product [Cyclocybe aegerita]|uniref:Uncharacterized protein n=1 Tax=Cyclocybe aegerita TaxID=1973307 RepID=A0A8S0VSS2_CYCAE|nr:unnamed protein product [Cyclocybe aegerita]
MFLLAHAIEFYYKLQSRLPWLLPPIKGEIVNVQPALFDVAIVHIKIDDPRARLPPEEGGLGYRAPWTTLDGSLFASMSFNSNVSLPDEEKGVAPPHSVPSDEENGGSWGAFSTGNNSYCILA